MVKLGSSSISTIHHYFICWFSNVCVCILFFHPFPIRAICYFWYAIFAHCILNISGEFPMDCPLQDSRLRVHYKGMLINEEKTVFYDTRVDNNGQPLEFSSGEGAVSWSQLLMKISFRWIDTSAVTHCPRKLEDDLWSSSFCLFLEDDKFERFFLCVVGTWRFWDVCTADVTRRDITCYLPTWLCIWQVYKFYFQLTMYMWYAQL